MKLNLGCANRSLEGFVGVDIAPPAEIIADLRERWPWNDSSVEEVAAFDLIEHLPDRVHTMNELHRVLKPGGIARLETPNAARGAGYFQDPTHCAPWTLNSFQYFRAGAFAHKRLARAYGITAAFRVRELRESEYRDDVDIVYKIHAVLEAVK